MTTTSLGRVTAKYRFCRDVEGKRLQLGGDLFLTSSPVNCSSPRFAWTALRRNGPQSVRGTGYQKRVALCMPTFPSNERGAITEI